VRNVKNPCPAVDQAKGERNEGVQQACYQAIYDNLKRKHYSSLSILGDAARTAIAG